MKKYIFLVVSMLFLSKPTLADTLLLCDNCSVQQMREVVFSQELNLGQVENFYVIDPINREIRSFELIFEFELGFSKEVFDRSVPIDIEQAADNFFDSFLEFRATPDDATINQLFNNLVSADNGNSANFSGLLALQSLSNASGDSDELLNCSSSDIIFDFINSSRRRTQLFQDATINGNGSVPRSELFFRLLNTYNNLVSRAQVTVSAGVVQAPLLTFTTPVSFDDGGSLRVIRRLDSNTFDVVDGSVQDCNGNTIPTSADDVSGDFDFPNMASAEDFLDQIDRIPNVDLNRVFQQSACLSIPVITVCVQINESRFECTTRVPNCER